VRELAAGTVGEVAGRRLAGPRPELLHELNELIEAGSGERVRLQDMTVKVRYQLRRDFNAT
jgi:hypothetical protein